MRPKKRLKAIYFAVLFLVLALGMEWLYFFGELRKEAERIYYGEDLQLHSAVLLKGDGKREYFELTIANEGNNDGGMPRVSLESKGNSYFLEYEDTEERRNNAAYDIPSGETIRAVYYLDIYGTEFEDEEQWNEFLKEDVEVVMETYSSITPNRVPLDKTGESR